MLERQAAPRVAPAGDVPRCREVDETHLAILEESARVGQDVAAPEAEGPLRPKLLLAGQRLQAGVLERETEVCQTPALLVTVAARTAR